MIKLLGAAYTYASVLSYVGPLLLMFLCQCSWFSILTYDLCYLELEGL
jgi:hypothetical protein